ncbi:MAG: insulinase family protein [Bacteroidetes Order II. Incertae sedis bacterium]|nr:insulinase family protein [Bacteroidetes Order II. bacterium]
MKAILAFFLGLLLTVHSLVAQKADRTKPPVSEAPRSLMVPKVEQFILKNGVKVYYLQKTGVPHVSITIRSNGGTANDPEDKIGLATATATLMRDGAGNRNALQLSDEIDYLGIMLQSYASADEMSVGLFTPVSRLDAALDLMRDVVLKPRFEAAEWERRQRESLVALAQAHDEARIIASTAFNQLIYGKAHPFARRATESTLKNISIADIQGFYRQTITAANSSFLVVGDVAKETIKAKLDARFGLWKGGTAKKVTISDPAKTIGRTLYLVDKPGAAQTELRFGSAGVRRSTPDYFAITIMNTILGGSFSSRLNQNIRETHGYAYGANSGFSFPRSVGHFIASSAVQTDVTDKAVNEFMKELTNIRNVSDDEMNRARNYEALGYPENFGTVNALAANISEKITHNLPDNYFNTYVPNILGLTKTQIERAAQQYVDPANMVIVMVGDLSKIRDGIEALSLGPIKVLTKEEVLGAIPVLK